MNTDLVVKHNDLIQNKENHGTLGQNKITAVLLANKMSNFEEDKIDMQFSLTRNELLDMLHISKGGKNYLKVTEELHNFNQTCVLTWKENYEREDGTITQRVVSMPFFEELAYYEDTQGVEGKWNKNIIPYLRALTKHYYSYSLTEYLQLNSNHSQILYELMKSYLGQGYITFNVDDLRRKLGCDTQKTYQDFKNFNRFILNKDIKEINEKTDINIAITKRIKDSDGKTVKSLLFEISNKNLKKAYYPEYPTVLLTEGEYDKLFHKDLNVNLVKQCMYKLHQYLTQNPNKPITNHYRKIMEYYKAWKDEEQWEQTTFSSGSYRKPKQTIRKSDRLKGAASYELPQKYKEMYENSEEYDLNTNWQDTKYFDMFCSAAGLNAEELRKGS